MWLPTYFFFNDTATTEIYTLSLHDALPISTVGRQLAQRLGVRYAEADDFHSAANVAKMAAGHPLTDRSEEHTSELQSRQYLVCRLLLEKKHNEITFASLHSWPKPEPALWST